MLQGLLSPSSIPNRQMVPSPSSKNNRNLDMTDSHSTLCASHLKASTQEKDPKFCSFKKIRDMKVRQNSERGKVIKQYVIERREQSSSAKKRMKTLDDAKTIVSHNSERSSIHHSKCIVEESIIIMRGGDQQAVQCFQEEPSTPFFKRRNTYSGQSKPSQYLKLIRHYPPLLQCIESGVFCHFDISEAAEEAINQIKKIQNEGVLQLYHAQLLPSLDQAQQKYLILYEPYTESLSEFVSGKDNISYKQFLSYLIEIIKILSHLGNQYIFPDIQPSTVLLSNNSLKIKIRPRSSFYLESERETLRQCGFYFNMLISELCHSSVVTPSKKIQGLSIDRRFQFQALMGEFIRTEQFTFDQAYLKLQALSD